MNDETQVPAPVARIVGGAPRTKSIALKWPVEFDGRVYTDITVRRITAGEVDVFVQSVRDGVTAPALPMFDAPPEVLAAMDADDSATLNEAAADFLPRALRGADTPSATSDSSQDLSPGT
jgi:hypothetical protein